MTYKVLLTYVGVLISLTACSLEPERPIATSSDVRTPSSGATVPVEQKLAALNAEASVPPDHPTVAQFRAELDEISKKCLSTNREHIADVSLVAFKHLKERGREETLLQTVRAINDAIPDTFVHHVDVDRVAAAIATMGASSQYRREKLASISTVLENN